MDVNDMEFKVAGKCTSAVDGDVVGRMILGITGKTYHGREVVLYRQEPGLFGTDPAFIGDKPRVQELTLCNGILNPIRLRNPPSAFWAIIDAASELKTGFTRLEAVDLAVSRMGEKQRVNLTKAWKAIKIHHKYLREDCGMPFMVDSLREWKVEIRARHEDETKGYFEKERSRRDHAEKELKEG